MFVSALSDSVTNKCHELSALDKWHLRQFRTHKGISIFHIHHSPFIVTLQNGYERMISVVKNESFVFVVNGEDVESNVIDAVLISTKVHESLRSTPGNFQFVINDENIIPTIFEHFLKFAHSRVFGDFS
jgi:hypothetical protein